MSERPSTMRRVIELVLFGNGILALFLARYWMMKIHSRSEIAIWWVLLLWFAFSILSALRDLLGKIHQKENPSP